jgi:hypothetical protein
MNKLSIALAAASLTVASFAAAQDFSQAPAYGSVTLNAGFTPDPHSVQITAGGSIDASTAAPLSGRGCRGFIANAPDYRLNYTSGSWPLIFRVVSDADTTLVVNTPDGAWHCIDDVEGLNPVIRFASPTSGQYDIWIGTYGRDMAASTLHITELSN